jgi:hypothetical protein
VPCGMAPRIQQLSCGPPETNRMIMMTQICDQIGPTSIIEIIWCVLGTGTTLSALRRRETTPPAASGSESGHGSPFNLNISRIPPRLPVPVTAASVRTRILASGPSDRPPRLRLAQADRARPAPTAPSFGVPVGGPQSRGHGGLAQRLHAPFRRVRSDSGSGRRHRDRASTPTPGAPEEPPLTKNPGPS